MSNRCRIVVTYEGLIVQSNWWMNLDFYPSTVQASAIEADRSCTCQQKCRFVATQKKWLLKNRKFKVQKQNFKIQRSQRHKNSPQDSCEESLQRRYIFKNTGTRSCHAHTLNVCTMFSFSYKIRPGREQKNAWCWATRPPHHLISPHPWLLLGTNLGTARTCKTICKWLHDVLAFQMQEHHIIFVHLEPLEWMFRHS
jgi:hypothetical protein